jgi:hypothetical protein
MLLAGRLVLNTERVLHRNSNQENVLSADATAYAGAYMKKELFIKEMSSDQGPMRQYLYTFVVILRSGGFYYGK